MTKLRRVNAELLAKSSSRKAKLAEAEAKAADLTKQLDESKQAFHEATVGVPMKALAEDLSRTPTLWLEQFSRHFDVELKEGELVLLNKDDQPVVDEQGKAIPVERDSLAKLVTSRDDSETTRLFQSITITTRASGAASSVGTFTDPPAKQSGPRFGLR